MSQITVESSINPPPYVPPKLTYEEFLHAYDGRYAEFVDSEGIVPMSVTERHDDVTGFLFSLLRIFIEERKLGKVKSEPYQMKMVIDGKIKGREPDVFVVKNEHLERMGERFMDGAADLVIEVISPDSIIRDTQDKFEEYEAAGVAEYWIVDPSRRTANFYGLGPEGRYRQLLLTEDGRFESRTIPALWIDPTWLWQDELPTVLSIVKLWQLQ